MGTLSGLLWLSRTALDADQSAINVTSNNVANQNTAGYTRETVSFTATDGVSLSGFEGEDEGVTATAVSQRSRVLEQQLQLQTQTSTSASARLGALQNVESLFGLSSTASDASATTLGSSINGLFTSLTSLSSNPTDAATRANVLTAASTLESAFNSTAQGLSSETSTLNSQIATAAQQINGLTATVAQLNAQITALSPDKDAGSLEDARQQAILQLSSLLGVNQISTESNGVTLTTSNGTVLVGGSQSYPVTTTSVDGQTRLVAGDPQKILSGDVEGGSIGGMMQVRDQDIPAMQSSMDQLAYALGSAINAQNQEGTTPSGEGGTALFSLPPSASGAAAAISVSMTSADSLATAGAGEGSAGTTNALALAALGTATIAGGETAMGYFADFVGGVGDTVSSASATNTAATASLSQAQTQRDSLSAVSLDEEASSLTQYQRSYEAAAKVFSIVDTMMADALNLGEQTTVS